MKTARTRKNLIYGWNAEYYFRKPFIQPRSHMDQPVEIFVLSLLSLALDCVDVALCTGLHICGVSFVSVNMHREFESWVHAHQHVSENELAVAANPYTHKRFIADAITKRVFGTHVNVPQCADHAAIDLDAALRTLQYATGRIRDVAALADGRSNAELELLSHCDLDLSVFARGSEDTDPLDTAFRSNNRELFLTGILTGLGEISVFRELMSFAEQRFDVFLCEMNMVRRNLDEEWLLLLCVQYARDVRAAQRTQRFARHHALLIGGHD